VGEQRYTWYPTATKKRKGNLKGRSNWNTQSLKSAWIIAKPGVSQPQLFLVGLRPCNSGNQFTIALTIDNVAQISLYLFQDVDAK